MDRERMDRRLVPGPGVPIDQVMAQRQQARMEALIARAQQAFNLVHDLMALEKNTPDLPRCRTLVNTAFDMTDYFQTQAQAPLKAGEGASD